MEHHSHRNLGHVLLVQGLERESRATTTAIRLAQIFAYGSESCLLIDLGPQGDASKRLGTTPTESGLLAQLLEGQESAGRMGLLIRSVAPGLDLVPYDLAVEMVASASIDEEAWTATLTAFRAQYDWIVVDCPPVGDKLGHASARGATQWIVAAIQSAAAEASSLSEKAASFCGLEADGSRRAWWLAMGKAEGDEASAGHQWDARGDRTRPGIWIPWDRPSQRGREAPWDDLETSFEQRATRAYIHLAKELKNSGRS